MIERLRIVGIGLGDPQHLTGEAVQALRSADVLLVPADGDGHPQPVAAVRALCVAVVPVRQTQRIVVIDGGDGSLADAYADAVEALQEHERIAVLPVWGDPAFDGSTRRLVDELVERYAAAGVDLDHDVVAGIGAPQLLASRHRISLGHDGSPVHLTTGARLVDEYDPALGDVVVAVDDDLACTGLADAFPDLELCWGAHLGTPDEVLVRGRLGEVLPEVRRARREARARRGWVLDAYLLRATADASAGHGPPAFPDVGELSDGVVTVRPVTVEDWEVVRDEHNNEESLRWDFSGEPLSDDDARRKAADAPRDWRRGRAARFVMVDAASGAGAGVIGVLRLGPPGTGLVGYGVLPAFRGRGFTTRALRLVSRWAFEEAGLARLELGHKVGNEASGRAAEKAGFRAQGRLGARLPNPDGTRSDEIYYSLVRPSAR